MNKQDLHDTRILQKGISLGEHIACFDCHFKKGLKFCKCKLSNNMIEINKIVKRELNKQEETK